MELRLFLDGIPVGEPLLTKWLNPCSANAMLALYLHVLADEIAPRDDICRLVRDHVGVC